MSNAWQLATITSFEQVPVGDTISLLQVAARSSSSRIGLDEPRPELVADDGETVSRFAAIPAPADRDEVLRAAYTVPAAVVRTETVFSLQFEDGFEIALPPPRSGAARLNRQARSATSPADGSTLHAKLTELSEELAETGLQARAVDDGAAETRAQFLDLHLSVAEARAELQALRDLTLLVAVDGATAAQDTGGDREADRSAEAELGQRLGEAEQGRAAAEQRLGETEQGWAAAEQRLGETEQGWAAAEQRLGELKQRLGEAEQRLGEAEQGWAAAEQRLGEAERRRAAADQRLGEATTRAEAAVLELAGEQDRLRAMEERIAQAELELQEVARERDDAVEGRRQAEESVDHIARARAERQLAELQDSLHQMSVERDELKRQASAFDEVAVKARERAAEAISESHQARSRLAELETWSAELERRLAETTSALADARVAAQADDSELRRLRGELAEAQAQLELNQAQVTSPGRAAVSSVTPRWAVTSPPPTVSATHLEEIRRAATDDAHRQAKRDLDDLSSNGRF